MSLPKERLRWDISNLRDYIEGVFLVNLITKGTDHNS
jgi:hypothetical protein